VVWTGLLKKPLDVVRRRPHRTLVPAHDGRDAHCAEATHFSAVAIVTAGQGRSPLKALFAPLIADSDTLLSTVSSDVGRCLLVTARCHLPASLCRVKHGCIIASGVLGEDAMRLLKCAPEEFVMSALPHALCAVFGQSAHTTLVSLVAILRFTMSSLPLPWRGLG
jgi:hypothetical protein